MVLFVDTWLSNFNVYIWIAKISYCYVILYLSLFDAVIEVFQRN